MRAREAERRDRSVFGELFRVAAEGELEEAEVESELGVEFRYRVSRGKRTIRRTIFVRDSVAGKRDARAIYQLKRSEVYWGRKITVAPEVKPPARKVNRRRALERWKRSEMVELTRVRI